ncbi:LADA_0H19592g1_1 [Lachancea dasiensis]|uniref:Topoisomerase I damage affected protein 11 n=1 Tax=Lachancea dasiensis TaxID=1072105 RepID=A0A1G4K6A7_9SACH|nr:LADA_0H19592g1_1 [Lachancea dasiensis]
MSNLDGFITSSDHAADMDTSVPLKSEGLTRKSTAEEPCPEVVTINSPNGSNKLVKVRPQASVSSPSQQEHPLRDTPTRSPPSSKFGRSATLKRVSLIQPMITPDSTPHEHRNQQQRHLTRTRSRSTVSAHSRSSSSASDRVYEPSTDVNSMLQLLANKELELLETKRKIEELRKNLGQEENHLQVQLQELQTLKTQVGKTLNSGMDDHKMDRNPQTAQTGPVRTEIADDSSQDLKSSTPTKAGSVWSKPLTLFSQIDQFIQHEMEKKLKWDDEGDGHEPRGSKEHTRPAIHHQPPEDVLGNMSSSLWNFVSDVKTGLRGISEEPQEQVDSQTQPGESRREVNRLNFVAKEVELEDMKDTNKQV